MKTMYTSPTFELLALTSTEEILKSSEEALDINVSFDELWGTGI